jgi:hypothetical protein
VGSGLREMQEDSGGTDGPTEKCCYRFRKLDHFARECQSKKKMSQGQANLAQEEVVALLLLEREVVHF